MLYYTLNNHNFCFNSKSCLLTIIGNYLVWYSVVQSSFNCGNITEFSSGFKIMLIYLLLQNVLRYFKVTL